MPAPSIYLRILSFYRAPPNLLAPNAFHILAGANVVFHHLELHLTPLLFQSFFQLKMGEPRVFYFTACPNCQFLKNLPSSQKGWKNLFFFSHLPDPLLTLERWVTKLPPLPDFQESRLQCSFERVKNTLKDHNYDIRLLINDDIALIDDQPSSFTFNYRLKTY